jgi:predicted ATP-grasp superfamily ATP-dependent carboligase
MRDPVLIAAFRGWNDAGDAASFAAEHLGRAWNGHRVGTIDPEDFFDFQAVRPTVHLDDGMTRRITWPGNDLFVARGTEGPRDALVLVGSEPNLKWRTFSNIVVEVARHFGVELVITLGALLADVPHTRAVPVTGTAADEELVKRLGLQRSRYEGPTGIVGVLHDAFRSAGIASASLWAAVPHYLAVTPNPKAALALVESAVGLVGAPADVDSLARASVEYERRMDEIIAADDDASAYVRVLEERADERGEQQSLEELDPSSLPSGDALAAELEHFLRQRNDGDDSI